MCRGYWKISSRHCPCYRNPGDSESSDNKGNPNHLHSTLEVIPLFTSPPLGWGKVGETRKIIFINHLRAVVILSLPHKKDVSRRSSLEDDVLPS